MSETTTKVKKVKKVVKLKKSSKSEGGEDGGDISTETTTTTTTFTSENGGIPEETRRYFKIIWKIFSMYLKGYHRYQKVCGLELSSRANYFSFDLNW